MMRIALALVPFLLLVPPAPCPAAETGGHVKPGQTISGLLDNKGQGGNQTLSSAPMEWGVIVRLSVGALLLVALGGGLVFIQRRRTGWAPKDGLGGIQVVGRTALSPRHFVYVLRMGGRRLVVGVSGDRMSSLAVVEDAAAARTAHTEVPASERKTDPAPAAIDEADLLPYRRQVNRLRELLRGRESSGRDPT